MNDEQGFCLREYLQTVVADKQKQLHELTKWNDEQCKKFQRIVDDLDNESSTTKEQGDKLERVVEFIIKNSFFFDIYKNIRTATNEIDEVIILSEQGKIALSELQLQRDVLEIDEDLFLGECKNYSSKLSVTYVGKFYSLMSIAGVSLGIIFTRRGLSGNSEGFEDAYGLTKVLKMMEQAKCPDKEFYILTFVDEDYRKMIEGVSFFEIVRAKKVELRLASNYQQFIQGNRHEAENEVVKAIETIKKN